MNPEPPQSLPQTLNPDGRGDPTTAPKDRKKYRKKYRKQIVGLAVLIIGLAGAAWLSLRSQDPRRRAAEDNRPISRAEAAKYLSDDAFFDPRIPEPPAPVFGDAPLGHPQFDSIQALAGAGIVTGAKDYRPDAPLTRAEASVFILRGEHGGGYNPGAGGDGITFNDVPTNHWAYIWINRISVEGITQGCSQNPSRYCPEEPLKRGDAAVFFLRGKHGGGYSPPAGGSQIFSDVPAKHPLYNWINQLSREGISGDGCGGGNYCPDAPLTRAQAAVFEQRSFNLPMTIHYFKNYTDLPPTHSGYTPVQAITNAGIVYGCSQDPPRYCPDQQLLRSEAAVFLLRAKHGGDYMPPAAGNSSFTDVADNYWVKDWIEQLYAEGISAGCSQNPLRYCPEEPTSNSQWAVWISIIKGEPAPTAPPPFCSGTCYNTSSCSAIGRYTAAGDCGEAYQKCCNGLIPPATPTPRPTPTPTPTPPPAYSCNGTCIPTGESCYRTGSGTCPAQKFCCQTINPPNPTSTPAPTAPPPFCSGTCYNTSSCSAIGRYTAAGDCGEAYQKCCNGLIPPATPTPRPTPTPTPRYR